MKAQSRSAVLTLLGVLAVALVGAAIAQENNGARPGSTLGGPAPLGEHFPEGVLISEGFDDITVLPGWFMQNNSSPIGVTDWFQGNDAVFPAQAGATTSYIAANFNNTAGSDISNWLLTPEIPFPIDELRFWTRTVTGNTFPDRIQVRLSEAGASTDVGTSATDVGDFTTVLLEINPALAMGGYPQVWTEFVITNDPALPQLGTGRIAFRYWVTNGGPAGANSNYIGIDTVSYSEGVPVPVELQSFDVE